MPDLDLQATEKVWLQQCGPCDFGLVEMGCNCPTGDYRPVMAELVAEIRQLRADGGLSAWRASSARGALHRVVGMIPTGALRNRVAELVADVDQTLFPDADREGARQGVDCDA